MERPACNEREHSAAERVAAALRESGYAAHVETFDSRGASQPWLACYAAASAVAAVLVYPLPLATVILGIGALLLHARDSDGRPLFFRSSCTGSNAVGLARHAPVPEVVVLAPFLDHAGAGPRRAPALGLQSLMVAIPAGGATAWIAEVDGELPSLVATAGVAAALAVSALALLLYRPPARALRETPAAAALLGLAPLLADRPVWLVATGAPGSPADAVRALVREHPRELAGCAWLNLVSSSEAGAVVAVSEEGAWRERRSDRWLLDAAEEAGAVARPYRVSTSVTPLLARRRRALTLLVGDRPDDLATIVALVTASSP